VIVDPKIREVYDVHIPFKLCNDPRPAVVVAGPLNGKVAVALISGQFDLYRSSAEHFKIDKEDPDFVATGLKKSCYVVGTEIIWVNVNRLIRKRGKVSGSLARRFDRWI
jgi:hypothetical protein